MKLKHLEAVQTGTRGAVVDLVTEFNDGNEESTLLVVGEQDDQWLIAGGSRISL